VHMLQTKQDAARHARAIVVSAASSASSLKDANFDGKEDTFFAS